MAYVGVRIEPFAQLAERPAFDEDDFGLRDVAARQLAQQLERRKTAADLVAAGLDRLVDLQPTRERHKEVGLDGDACGNDVTRHDPHPAARIDMKLERLAAQDERRMGQPVKRTGESSDEHSDGDEKAEKECSHAWETDRSKVRNLARDGHARRLERLREAI